MRIQEREGTWYSGLSFVCSLNFIAVRVVRRAFYVRLCLARSIVMKQNTTATRGS
jgi:hypothetical protein